MASRYAIILCGGSGTRLWPLSRTLKPKQLLPLNGDLTLLQQTASRLCKKVSPSNLYTVTHESHRLEVKSQLGDLFPEALDGVVSEPISKNTLPAVALAVERIYKKDPLAMVGVFASDHAIDDEAAFFEAWGSAEVAAESGYLTLLGIKPTNPATGYGYIKSKTDLQLNSAAMPVFSVECFVEKPSLNVAQQYVRDGYLWNSGMFVFRADIFRQMLSQYQPEIARSIQKITDTNAKEIYSGLPSLSIDYGIAEKADRVAVVPVDMKWSDLGNWESIYQRHVKDCNDNVTRGDVIATSTTESLLWSDSGLVTAVGVDNLVIIRTADATMVCNRERAEDVKLIVDDVKNRYPNMTETHLTVERPWGSYTVLEESVGFKIKSIRVAPGQKLSLQKHTHRSEHWVVVSGVATVTNNEETYQVIANESTYISAGVYHRLENRTNADLTLIEVQTGTYLGEDDITRIDDTYGRHE